MFLDWEKGVMGAREEDFELREEGMAEEDRGATRETATAIGSTLDQNVFAVNCCCSTLTAAKLGAEEHLLMGELCRGTR